MKIELETIGHWNQFIVILIIYIESSNNNDDK